MREGAHGLRGGNMTHRSHGSVSGRDPWEQIVGLVVQKLRYFPADPAPWMWGKRHFGPTVCGAATTLHEQPELRAFGNQIPAPILLSGDFPHLRLTLPVVTNHISSASSLRLRQPAAE